MSENGPDLICLHPSRRLEHDPKTLRIYCSRCYGSLTDPLPYPLNCGQMEATGVADLFQGIFDELPEAEACVVYDRLHGSINRNLEQAR